MQEKQTMKTTGAIVGGALLLVATLQAYGAIGRTDGSGRPAAAPPAAAQSAPASSARAKPAGRVLTKQELLDLALGSSIQASRGSNTPQMVQRLEDALAQGKTFRMVSVDEVPDDWMIVVPAGIGGGGAWEHVRERTAKQQLPTIADAQLQSIRALSRHIGKPFDAVVRIEASSAMVTALLNAAELGVPVVDACLSGRARPEVQQQITTINGIPSTPAAMVTRWGDEIIIDKAVDDYRAEDLSRAVAVASGGGSPMALSPMSGKDLKRGTIPGAVSQAILFGRTVREARAAGKDPIAALIGVSKGYELFRGVTTKSDARGDRGFSWVDVEIAGRGAFAGHTYKVYVKNENIVTWLDGKPDAMSPDFIANLDPRTGDTVLSTPLGAYPVGGDVVMVAFPAAPQWRTPKGLEVFGPRHFGFDFDYVPIETLQKGRTIRPVGSAQ